MKYKRKILIILIVLVLLVIGAAVWFQMQTYHTVEIVREVEESVSGNSNYLCYENGLMKYSKDGITYLTNEGVEIWNQPYQMEKPVLEKCGATIAVGDLQGTDIMVLEKKGMKGEIHTTKPIEAFSVSEQGIVCAILKDDEMPMVMCYDAKGNILVEHKTTFDQEGYPVDVGISYDGTTIVVSYLKLDDTGIASNVVYYHFGDQETQQYEVAAEKIEKDIVPMVDFVKENTSIVVADSKICLYDGVDKPEKKTEIVLDKQIENVSYDEKNLALLLKDEKDAYWLNVYNWDGKELSSEKLDKDFYNMSVDNGEIILYDGAMCAIYEKNGHVKFEGEMNANQIKAMYSISGLLKYMLISENGIQEVRLKK